MGKAGCGTGRSGRLATKPIGASGIAVTVEIKSRNTLDRRALHFVACVGLSSKSVCLNERGRRPRAHACGQADLETKLSTQRYARCQGLFSCTRSLAGRSQSLPSNLNETRTLAR